MSYWPAEKPPTDPNVLLIIAFIALLGFLWILPR